jgi:hypothetical protein
MMTARQKLLGTLILGLLLALTAGAGLAREPGGGAAPLQGPTIEAAVSSEFSYQGLLQEGGEPVTGSRNMVFRLHSNAACTSQVGGDIARPGVSVIDGYFDVSLEVDQGDVNGQGLWLEARVEGTSVACQEILPVPYALSLKPGAVISGSGTGIWAYSSDQYAFWGETESTLDYHTALRGRATGATGFTRGVVGSSDSNSGIGVLGHANSTTGLTYGVYGQTYSSSGGARGVYGFASADYGNTYGVYGKCESTDGGAGGYFEGYTGVFGKGAGANGYGGHFESAQDDALRVHSAGDDGIHIDSAGDNGVYVDSADWHGVSIYQAEESGVFVGEVGDAGVWVWLSDQDGVRVSGAGDDGVYADTLLTSHEWGLYTPDKLYVGTTALC